MHTRRRFLATMTAWPLMTSVGQATELPTPLPFAGRIVREREPLNLEFPFATLQDFRTPTEAFYVRNHFPVPQLDRDTFRLSVEGAVEKPTKFTLTELEKLPSTTQYAFLECAGNGRIHLPKARGVQWHLGAIGNAEWTGVSLPEVLNRVGVRKGAVEVILEGADVGTVGSDPPSPGPISFTRSIPLATAMRPQTLLAYAMNGQPLLPNHGFPLRAVVGGWYGMASIKWLTRIIVTDRPFAGFWQTADYTFWERRDNLPVQMPITVAEVKSTIARPFAGEVVPADRTYRVHGAAWSGAGEVTRVELSFDNGKTWTSATLGPAVAGAWRLWHYTWRTPVKPGPVSLMARASDAAGRTQPLTRDTDRKTYMVSHVIPVEAIVQAS